ncbi:Glutamate receptor 2.7 [Morella rubra]|uniref:Glutamate receptor 2.7 n=1 Tax=Morella rubra TaxID=262757 RepID=A0A6A1WFH5_9ROSI|nr:Glutamate receptor 2.7 [Morella rubra]
MDSLPYAVPYEFIPFAKPDGESAVWVLEHRINEDFGLGIGHINWGQACGLPSQPWSLHKLSAYFTGEPVISNCARTVVIIWVFVVLILTQSYTASLTSLLTVQQLQPTFTDVNQLIKDRANVGYQEGSFVLGILQQMNFKNISLSNTITRKNVMNCCQKEAQMVVFPKGSPLVADVSSAILNITEGDQMKQIEDSWLGAQTNCPDSNNPQVSSGSLSLSSFSGLFLIAGAASVAALIFNFFMFLRRERQEIFRSFGNQVSVIERIRHVLKIFDSIDASHSVGRKLLQDKSDTSNIQGASELPQNLGSPPTPSNSSTQMESPSRNPGTSLPEDADPDVNVQTSQVAATIELTPQSNPEGSTITEIQDDNN